MKPSLLALLLIFVAACARHESTPPAVTLPPIRVQAAQVRAENLPQFTDVTGTVRPVHRAVLATKVAGSISELPIALGQRVQSGEVLLKIFSADLAARLMQARAELNVARRDLEREQGLLEKGASTAETVRELKDRLTIAEAGVRDAEVQLSYTEIRAPFDGVIAREMVNAGDFATPGHPLIEVEGMTDFEVEAFIPESFVPALEPGATFDCEAAGVSFTGILREISSAADITTRSVGVKIAVPAGTTVRSGLFTRVRVPGAAVLTLLVPATAVSAIGQMERVFVVEENDPRASPAQVANTARIPASSSLRAALRLVKTGAVRHADGQRHVEILSGLSADDRVVIAPPASLRDGQPLEVQP